MIQVPDAAGTRAVEGIALELRTTGSEVTTDLQAFSLEGTAGDPTNGFTSAPVTTLPLDRWVTVSIVVDLSSASTLRASLAYDGADAGEVHVTRAPASLEGALLTIGAAIPYAHAGPAPFVAAFDNVLFDVE